MKISKKLHLEVDSASMGLLLFTYTFLPFYIAITVGGQCFYWLVEGVWFPVTTADVLNFLGINVSGFYAAERMLGFFKIMQFFVELPSILGVPLILILLVHTIRWIVLKLLSVF
jgi:hypothetical protein